MSTFSTILKINGFPIDKAKEKLEVLKSYSFSRLMEYQEKQKWNIVQEHFQNNPFYKKICNNIIPKDWSEVKILRKKDLQRPINQMLNPTVKKQDLFLSKTSGSTGVPMAFAKDKFCHALTWSQILYKYSLHGIQEGDLQARFYGMPVEGFSYYKERLKDFLSNRRRFVVNDLSENVLDNYIEVLKRSKFKYIYGYTNSIKTFAKHLVRKGLFLKDICPTVKCCIITSEVCTPLDEQLLKDTFLVPIINEYGASELGVIAFPDKDFKWKLSDEDLFVEIVDENGKIVENGQEGRIVVTALYNKAMPLIRYELGDIASINNKSEGNYLGCLQGRLTDTLRLPSGRIMPGATLYIASKLIYDKLPELKEFIIKQTATDTIEYDLVVDSNIENKVKDDIISMTLRYLEPGLKVKINKVKAIKRTGSGKFKFFQSFIDSPEIISTQ